MDIATQTHPNTGGGLGQRRSLREHIRFPDTITTGRYDASGNPDPDGRLLITARGTAFAWARFSRPLASGEEGEMVFTNLPGTFLLGVSMGEWDDERDEPTISDALVTLGSVQRGNGIARVIGRNTYDEELSCAIGIVVADDAAY